MKTLYDLVENGTIKPGTKYKVLTKTVIDLFPFKSTEVAYSEFYVSDVVTTSDDTIIFVDYITGKQPKKEWMSLSLYKKTEVIRCIEVDTNAEQIILS
jgi:hypothetical protein